MIFFSQTIILLSIKTFKHISLNFIVHNYISWLEMKYVNCQFLCFVMNKIVNRYFIIMTSKSFIEIFYSPLLIIKTVFSPVISSNMEGKSIIHHVELNKAHFQIVLLVGMWGEGYLLYYISHYIQKLYSLLIK